MSGWNAVGLKTLFAKEVRRFSKVWGQTVFSPLISTSLYFLVFGVALGSRLREIDGIPYIQYVVPGLIMLAMINNSFLNTASSLFQSKMNGTLLDLLVAPLGASEIVLAYTAAAVARGILVGTLVWAVSVAFIGVHIHSLVEVVWFSFTVTASFSFLGLLISLWAEKWDHLSLLPNFILSPLTFLGGVFYSVTMLPEPWGTISRANPILYMVNGMRHGLMGVSDVAVLPAAIACGVLTVTLGALCVVAFERGYKIRS